MKKQISLIAAVLIIITALFSSCESDMEKVTATIKSVPGNVAADKSDPYVCTPDNAKDTAFVFFWSKANYGENISCTYYLQFDVAGNNFASPYEMSGGINITRLPVTSNDMNSIMHKLGLPIDVPANIEVRVKAQPMVIGSSQPNLEIAVSDSKATVNVTSYAMPPVHILGSMFGAYLTDPNAWNPANYEYVMFRDNPLSVDVYVASFQGFNTTTYAGQMALLNDADLGKWNQITKTGPGKLGKNGSNIEDITVTGYYTFTVDMAKMTYSIAPYDVSQATAYTSIELSGLGGTPVPMSQAFNNPHIWVVDNVALKTTDAVKFQANGSSSNSWGSDTFPWGKGTSGGESIQITRAGNYFIKFNDLTGHYVFYKK